MNVVNVRKKDILLITAHDKKYFGGDEHIHIEVRDVDALIEMLILGQREAVRRGSESGAGWGLAAV